MEIIEGGPAHLSKALKIGDKIIAVDQEPVIGLEITEAVELIRGQQGTPVTLTIVRTTEQETKTFDVKIIRDEVILKDSRFDYSTACYGDGVIAILKLHSFYQVPSSNSADDLKNALKTIQETQNVKGGSFMERELSKCFLYCNKLTSLYRTCRWSHSGFNLYQFS